MKARFGSAYNSSAGERRETGESNFSTRAYMCAYVCGCMCVTGRSKVPCSLVSIAQRVHWETLSQKMRWREIYESSASFWPLHKTCTTLIIPTPMTMYITCTHMCTQHSAWLGRWLQTGVLYPCGAPRRFASTMRCLEQVTLTIESSTTMVSWWALENQWGA